MENGCHSRPFFHGRGPLIPAPDKQRLACHWRATWTRIAFLLLGRLRKAENPVEGEVEEIGIDQEIEKQAQIGHKGLTD